MDPEAAFQAAIDATPRDTLPRLVFCDWLDERADRRAEGYRVLATFDRWPQLEAGWSFWVASDDKRSLLSDDWWELWRAEVCRRMGVTPDMHITQLPPGTLPYRTDTRREAMDIAALVWTQLTPEQQQVALAELTGGTPAEDDERPPG